MKWNSHPFVRITPVFILGIGAYEVLKTIVPAPYIWGVALPIFLFYIYQSITDRYRKEISHGAVAGLLSFLILGVLVAQVSEFAHKPSISHEEIKEVSYYTIVIKSKPSPTEKTNKYRAKMDQVKLSSGIWTAADADVLLYVKNTMEQEFEYGDRLLIKGHPTFLERQKNPYAFDYTLFLQRKGIYLQEFLQDDLFVKLPLDRGFSFAYLKIKMADYFEQVLEKYISSDRELNLAKAMLTGRKDNISHEMESVYAATGTAHILAVSGLHEGIIYLLVSLLLSKLKNGKWRWFYYGANLFAIWAFAMVTGLSPSAQRAATMLSCIIIAQFSGRKSSIYNSILFSAFVLLLFSPNLIYSVSFQLSYAAVFGIVYLYPKLYRLLYVESKIVDFFWQITVLSIATQLATFPISVYYFHQFPLTFPLTNLIAIPTATAVISGGMLLLFTAQLGIVPVIIGKVLSLWIGVYNDLMMDVSKWPFHALTDIYLKPLFVVFLIATIFLLVQFLSTKKLVYFKIFTLVLVVFSLAKMYEHFTYSSQKEVVFYAMNDTAGVDIFIGNQCFTNMMPMDSIHFSDIQFNMTPARKYHLIKDIQGLDKLGNVRQIGGNTWIRWGGKTILILENLESLPQNMEGFSLDFVLIGKGVKYDASWILEGLNTKNLILDMSIPRDVVDKLKYEKGQKSMNIHAIRQDGAFIIRI